MVTAILQTKDEKSGICTGVDKQTQIKVTDCKYKEYYRRLKEKFINGLDVETIKAEMIKELTALEDTNEVSSEQLLMCAQRVEAQTVQKVLGNIRDARELDSVRRDRQKCGNNRQ